ncbi:amidase family protein [Amycolatopsis coloradensis]|uniref:amidase n=1 Tax=Amycolatopsis coloradensis TaxID=76021 RepID=UPI0033FD796B
MAFRSATELARLIATRELSPVELMKACIARIEERNPSLNALVHTDLEHARSAAVAAEKAVMAGEEIGPLHGVPTAIKDLFSTRAGWVATFGGIPALKNFVADQSSLWVERMEAAGAVILGSTNSPVLGFRGVCDNALFGPTCNPFDMTRNSGGSSGGGAAAVADGLVPFAEGTDAGGSIRIPAAWTNLVGHKPSAGRVPLVMRPDAFGGTAPFIHEGAMTRTVEDTVTTLRILVGADHRDPFSVDERPGFADVLGGDVRGMRIAYSPGLGVHQVEPVVADAVGQTVRSLEEAGAFVALVDPEIRYDQTELSDLWCRCVARMVLPIIENFRERGLDLVELDQIPAPLLRWLDHVADERLPAQSRDSVMRTHVFDAIQHVLTDHDLLVCPTVGALPVVNGPRGETLGPARVDGVAVDPSIGWTLTYLLNFTGHPACSVPAGLVDGLPVGMQIIGRRFADGDVLRAAAAVERHRPWASWYPARRGGSGRGA